MIATKTKMADRIARFDWATTPLGPIESWPPSLRTAVDICLASPVPSFVWWSPALINIYNDAYAPLLGAREPTALGQPARTLWASVWPTVSDDVERVLREGVSIIHERQRFVEKREGFPDEMFFTYTFSPIADGANPVGGIFQVALDETPRVLAERAAQQARAKVERHLKNTKAENQARLARWQTIIAHMVEGVILVDARGTLCDWNDKALKMFGCTPSSTTRETLSDLFAEVEVYGVNGELISFEQRPISRLLRGEPIRNEPIRLRHRDRERDVLAICNGALIHADDNRARMALLTLHDTTDDARPMIGKSTIPTASLDPLAIADPANQPLGITVFSEPLAFAPSDRESATSSASRIEAAQSAEAVETFLAKMQLTSDDQAFCTSLGEELVESAIDAYLQANSETRRQLSGSCVAASLAVAMIIVHDV